MGTFLTPDAAGRVGQILVVLILVALFAPQLRGRLATVVVRDQAGQLRRIPEQPRRIVRWFNRYDYVSVVFGLAMVVVDALLAMLTGPLHGSWTVVFIAGNGAALGASGTQIAIMSYRHSHQNGGRPEQCATESHQ